MVSLSMPRTIAGAPPVVYDARTQRRLRDIDLTIGAIEEIIEKRGAHELERAIDTLEAERDNVIDRAERRAQRQNRR